MSNNLGRTEVSVSQTDKETTINNSDARIDAAITDTITYTWAGAETLKTATTAETQQHVAFVFAGSTSGTPSFKFGNVQRGFVLVQNNQLVSIDVSDFSSATTITVLPGTTVAMYVTSAGIYGVLESSSVVLASAADVLAGTEAAELVTPATLFALWKKATDVPSANPLVLGDGGFFHITGTTNFSDIDFTVATNGRRVWLVFDGILTITHHATTLVLPGGANITTAAGDRMEIIQDDADNIICLQYVRATGNPLIAPFDVSAYVPGTPTVSVMFWQMLVARGCVFADDWAGSYARVETNPSSTVNIDIHKNGVSIGTLSIANTGVATFSTSGGATTLAASDRLTFIAPADLFGLVGLTFVLKGDRT